MNVEHNRRLQQYLAPLMRASGYGKERATWRSVRDESILVFNIQGSRSGPAIFINLAVYFRVLGTDAKPLEYDCHLRARLNGLVPDPLRLIRLLDFGLTDGAVIPDDVRHPEIRQLVEHYGLPWLNRYSTLQRVLQEGPQGHFYVSPQLRARIANTTHP
jgi:hypothetical protein